MMNKEYFIKWYCSGCGSQRCDGSDEWMEGCRDYQRLVMGVEPVNYEKLMREAKNEEKHGVLTMFKRWKQIIASKL